MDVNQITSNLMLMAIGFLVVAGVLVGAASLQTDQISYTCTNTSHTKNSSHVNCYGYTCDSATIPTLNGSINCYNATGSTAVNYTTSNQNEAITTAGNVTSNVAKFANSIGTQLPTVGTMFGVALILGAIGLIGVGIAVGARYMR